MCYLCFKSIIFPISMEFHWDVVMRVLLRSDNKSSLVQATMAWPQVGKMSLPVPVLTNTYMTAQGIAMPCVNSLWPVDSIWH